MTIMSNKIDNLSCFEIVECYYFKGNFGLDIYIKLFLVQTP